MWLCVCVCVMGGRVDTNLWRFLFLRFLCPPGCPPVDEERAFWGFPLWAAPSDSSGSSGLGSFSWFWESGDPSLSEPLPGSSTNSTYKIDITVIYSHSFQYWVYYHQVCNGKIFFCIWSIQFIKAVLTFLYKLVLNSCHCTDSLHIRTHRHRHTHTGLSQRRIVWLQSLTATDAWSYWVTLNIVWLTATEVTDDLLKRRSASLNLRFRLSFLLFVFL